MIIACIPGQAGLFIKTAAAELAIQDLYRQKYGLPFSGGFFLMD